MLSPLYIPTFWPEVVKNTKCSEVKKYERERVTVSGYLTY